MSSAGWLGAEDAIGVLRGHAIGMTDEQVGAALGRHPKVVGRMRRVFGLEPRGRSPGERLRRALAEQGMKPGEPPAALRAIRALSLGWSGETYARASVLGALRALGEPATRAEVIDTIALMRDQRGWTPSRIGWQHARDVLGELRAAGLVERVRAEGDVRYKLSGKARRLAREHEMRRLTFEREALPLAAG